MAFPSTFPTDIDSYVPKTDGIDDVMAVDVNELQSAILAIETAFQAVAHGTAQYQILVTGASPFAPAWSAGRIVFGGASSLLTLPNAPVSFNAEYHVDIVDPENEQILKYVTASGTWANSSPYTVLHALVGPKHFADGLTAGQILIATAATTFGWSAGRIVFGGAQTYTFPNATGTVPLGTGTNTYVTYWTGTNSVAGSANMTFDATNGIFRVTSPYGLNAIFTSGAVNVSAVLRFVTANRVGQADTGHDDLQFFDGAAMAFRFLCAVGNNPASTRYGGFLAYADRDGNKLPLWFGTQDANGTLDFGLVLSAGHTAGTKPKIGIGTTAPAYGLDVSTNIRCSTGFGCNGATPQTAYSLGAASTDLATVIALANKLRLMAIGNGTGSA